MKRLFFLTIFCLFSALYAETYEKELEKFCQRAEALLELDDAAELLDLSGTSKPLESFYDAGAALLPQNPIEVLKTFESHLKPGSKALLVFYPSDEGFHKIAGTQNSDSSTSLQEFKDAAHALGFEVLYSNLKRHLAFFENRENLHKFANKYLKTEIEDDLLSEVLTNRGLRVPTKLAVILIKKTDQSVELKK